MGSTNWTWAFLKMTRSWIGGREGVDPEEARVWVNMTKTLCTKVPKSSWLNERKTEFNPSQLQMI